MFLVSILGMNGNLCVVQHDSKWRQMPDSFR